MTVRELVTIWGFDVDTKKLDTFEKRLGSLKNTVKHLGEFIGAEAVALFGLAESTAAAGVEAKTTAEKLGTTATKLQELQYAAKMSHVEVESMNMGLRLLSAHALRAAQGGEEANLMFLRLKTNVRDTHGHLKTSDQLLMDLASHWGELSEAQKPGMAMQLFGRAGAQLIPLLNKGPQAFKAFAAEAHSLGVVLDEGAIKKSEAFMDSLHRLEAMLQGLKNTVGVALMPVITGLIRDVSQWFMANRQIIVQNLNIFIREMAENLKSAWNVAVGFGKGLWTLVQALGGVQNVLKLVVAGFAVISAAKTLMGLWSLVKVIQEIAAAFKIAAIFEALATGGLSFLAGAAVLAGAGIAYSIYDSHQKQYSSSRAESSAARPYVGGSSNSKNLTLNYRPQVTVHHSGAAASTPSIMSHVHKALEGHYRKVAADLKNNIGS